MVSISFGIALVAGRTRVPRPATGNTALRIFMARSEALKRCGNGRRCRICAGWDQANPFAAGNKGRCVVGRLPPPLAQGAGRKQISLLLSYWKPWQGLLKPDV